jgi:transcriptional regulator with XRE-family HTH domain
MLRLFGDKLRYLRQQHRMTQTDLARRLVSVSQSHLSHLEAGRKAPSLDLVVELADVFMVQTDYLLRDTIPADQPLLYEALANTRSDYLHSFGTALRHLRITRAMTQTALADLLVLASHSHISYLETERKEPSIELVLRVGDLFDVTTDYLLRGDSPRQHK